jgi:hypothetical protein
MGGWDALLLTGYTAVVPARLIDLNAEIDALYQLPLKDFISARNSLATRVRSEQGKEAADHVKALEKPGVSAWVVNQLFWRYRQEFNALLQAGESLRLAQQQRLTGDESANLAHAMAARHSATEALLVHSAELLHEAGHKPSPEMRQRVGTTLEALATHGKADGGPRVGRLTRDVDPPGFATLAALFPGAVRDLPSAPAPALKPVERAGPRREASTLAPSDKKRVDEARRAVTAADAEANRARARHRQALGAREAADAAWEEARRNVAEARRTLDEATEVEQRTQREREERRRELEAATAALSQAERTLAQARMRLEH